MVTIEAPIKVISEANSRGHWAKGYKRGAGQRIEMQYYWRQALKGRKVSPPCTVRLTRIACGVELDDDNLRRAFKAIRDQIAAEIGIDDGSKLILFEYDQEIIHKRQYSIRVEVIEEAQEEAA